MCPRPLVGVSEHRGGVRGGPQHARELAALQELPPLAAPARDLVLGRADGLFGAARGFDRQQVAVAARRDEAEDAVLVPELDQDNPAAGSREIIHLADLAEQPAALRG